MSNNFHLLLSFWKLNKKLIFIVLTIFSFGQIFHDFFFLSHNAQTIYWLLSQQSTLFDLNLVKISIAKMNNAKQMHKNDIKNQIPK